MNGERQRITILGENSQAGAYILRIRVEERLALAFGRFRGGQTVEIEPGVYLYVGSAMGKKGASTLARRLVRHATRSGDLPPHAVRAQMLATFTPAGLGSGDLRPRRGKTLFWHVDYLLDRPSVTLSHLLVVRAQRRLEGSLAHLVSTRPYTSVPARGLGASDTQGDTHLFHVQPVAGWWEGLVTAVNALLADPS